MSVKLTFGMPHYDDPRAKFTIQSLLMHQDWRECEILVVDASPNSASGKDLKEYVDGLGQLPVRYVPLPENRGPAYNKNMVFHHAQGEIVVCCDCHELFFPGTIQRILKYYQEHPDFKGLLTGPLWWGGGSYASHFDNIWRGAMWGTWATDPRANHPESPPFEVWGQGCGFFVCKKDAWLGFHPEARGFGAEEGCIHEKFRQAGHPTICHPGLRWWHDFGKVGKGGFPVYLWDKVRNYVLEFQSMNMDLKPIHDHFVSLTELRGKTLSEHLIEEHSAKPEDVNGKTDLQLEVIHKSYKLTQREWEHLLADPIKNLHQPPRSESLDTLYDMLLADPHKNSDTHIHMPEFKNHIATTDEVVEVGRRSEFTIGILHAKPKKLTSYLFYNELKIPVERIINLQTETEHTVYYVSAYTCPNIVECDVLVHKTPHNHHELMEDLKAWEPKVRKKIIIHDVTNHAEKLDDGSLGYGMQIRAFLLDHKDWEIKYFSNKQYGLVVLERQPQPREGKLKDPWPVGKGPGTNLKNMNTSIGVNPAPNCSCNALMVNMDHWGSAGCKEKREEIISKIQENYEKWTWKEKFNLVAAAGKAVMNGLAFKINPLHPIASMVDEAIRQAEEEGL